MTPGSMTARRGRSAIVSRLGFRRAGVRASLSAVCALAALGGAEQAAAQSDGPRSVIPWIEEAVRGDDSASSVITSTPGAATGGAQTTGDIGALQSDGRAGLPPQIDMSVTEGETSPLDRGPSAPPPDAPTTIGGVEVADLDRLEDSAAGLISAKELGLPLGAWRDVSEAEAVALTLKLRPTRLRAVNSLAVRLLLAALEPPISDPTGGATPETDLLTARIDALMRFGAAEAAMRLAETAGLARAAKSSDAAFVSGSEETFCRALLDPSELGSLPRIYCQIVAGDSFGALVALDASRALGETDQIGLGLLEAFAEPELLDLAEPPSSIDLMKPLHLAVMRRIGLPLPQEFARAAPLTLLPAILGPEATPRQTLIALERLERAGALPTAMLAAAYESAASAESGGVWGRVEAYRRVALQAGASSGAVGPMASAALARASEAGMREMMARLLGETLARAGQDALAAAGGGWTVDLRDALRLAGYGDLASELMRSGAIDIGVKERIRDRIAAPNAPTVWNASQSAPLLPLAVRGELEAGRMLAALDAFGAPIADPGMFADDAEIAFAGPGRSAALAFEAIALLSQQDQISPDALHGAITRLIAIGLTDDARKIAIEAVLLAD